MNTAYPLELALLIAKRICGGGVQACQRIVCISLVADLHPLVGGLRRRAVSRSGAHIDRILVNLVALALD